MSGELLTVKEYAQRLGITEQAAYKKIRNGKVQTVEIKESGKNKKFILFEENKNNSDEKGENPETEKISDNAGLKKDDSPSKDLTAAALEKAIDVLSAQLEEKDRQISRLTELLNQSQKLQAHSQKLLEQETQTPPNEEPEEKIEDEHGAGTEPANKAEKRKGFWAWLFG